MSYQYSSSYCRWVCCTNSSYCRRVCRTNSSYCRRVCRTNSSYCRRVCRTNSSYCRRACRTNSSYCKRVCRTCSSYCRRVCRTSSSYCRRVCRTSSSYCRRVCRTSSSCCRRVCRTLILSGRWSDRRIRILSPASGRPPVLLVEAPARFVAASTGPVVLMVSVPSPASLGARLGRRRILGLVLLMRRRRPSVLPYSGSSKT